MNLDATRSDGLFPSNHETSKAKSKAEYMSMLTKRFKHVGRKHRTTRNSPLVSNMSRSGNGISSTEERLSKFTPRYRDG